MCIRNVAIFLFLVSIASCGIRKKQNNEIQQTAKSDNVEEVKNTSTSTLDVIDDNPEAFSINEFVDNPFSDTVFVPKLLEKTQDDFLQGNESQYIITEYSKDIGDSNIPFLHLVHKGYELDVWTSKEKDWFFRNSMKIESEEYNLKYGIKIGQDMNITLDIIKKGAVLDKNPIYT